MSTFTQLISPAQLHSILYQDNLILLDASIAPVGSMVKPDAFWPKVALPNARRFDIETEFCEPDHTLPHMMPSAEQFNQQAQQLGIHHDSQIVVYDAYGLFSSARAWWMFRAMGHNNVAVLNGGLPLWLQSQFPVENTADSEPPAKGNFVGEINRDYFCNAEFLLSKLNDDSYKIIDARAHARFVGETPEPRVGLRSGHMPGAINLPYTELLHDGQILQRSVLKHLFTRYRTNNETLITSCGSGVTACVIALAATIAGIDNVCVYDGSWAEWGQRDDCPVVK